MASFGWVVVNGAMRFGGAITVQGTLTSTASITTGGDIVGSSAGGFYVSGSSKAYLWGPANGTLNMANAALTIGSQLKFDALPTISSGFGTSPAVTAGSTALAGSINVGTGGVATTGVVLWNGTAFPSTPFIVCTCSLGAVPTVAVATTTQVTFTTSVAWPASTILNWIVISAK